MSNPTPRRRVPRSVPLGAAGFCASISWQVVLPVLPLHLAGLGYSPAGIGILVGLFSLTMGVVELEAGVIAAAIGRRRAILVGYAANALCLTVAAIAQARALVAGALAAVGASRGVLVPPLHATVADSAAAEARGRAFGLFWLFASLAALTGPAAGGFVAGRYGTRAPFVLGTLFSVAALPIIAAQPIPGRQARGASFAEFAAFLSNRSIARVGLCMILSYSLAGIWTTFLPLYAAQHGASVVAIGWIFAVQGAVYVVMQVPTGRLVALQHGEWLAPIGIAAMSATELIVPLLRSTPLLLVAGAVYGTALGIMPVTFATLVTHGVSSEQYTPAMSVYNSAIDLGLFVGPLLGAAVARFHTGAPFLLALPIGLAALAMSLRRPHTTPSVASGSH